MLHGSAWAVALRWCVRGTGLVSTLILVRLLSPADFGIIAMSMLLVGTLEALTETRQDLALIRYTGATREHYDSAWTISVLVGFGAAIAIFASAPLAVNYFHTPSALPVIRCLALRPIVVGFENIGVVDFRKGLRFDSQFRYVLAQRLITFAVTIAAACVLRSYWALVIGILTSRAAATVLSYIVHPYRPRFCFSRAAELWSFSGWAWLRHVGSFFTSKADEFVVGGMGAVGGLPGAVAMGRYSVAADIAASPTDELVVPMLGTLFPVMATIQGDVDELRRLFLKVLSLTAVVACAASVGVALVSDGIVTLALGSQWLSVESVLPWIALSQGMIALGAGVYIVLDVLGRQRDSALAQWARLILLLVVLVPLGSYRNLEIVAAGRLFVACLVTPTLLWSLSRVLAIPARAMLNVLWRPLVSAAAMSATLFVANAFLPLEPAVRLVSQVFIGAGAYVGAMLLLWNAVGTPAGTERDILDRCKQLIRRRPSATPHVPSP